MQTSAPPLASATDLDLEAEVRAALRSLDTLRPTRSEVNVSVAHGRVSLTGIVPSRIIALEAERAVRDVPGVVGVANDLADDGSLTLLIARGLATDARTRDLPPGYQVTSFFGRVTILGPFVDEHVRTAVAEVARRVPGVRSVTVKQA